MVRKNGPGASKKTFFEKIEAITSDSRVWLFCFLISVIGSILQTIDYLFWEDLSWEDDPVTGREVFLTYVCSCAYFSILVFACEVEHLKEKLREKEAGGES